MKRFYCVLDYRCDNRCISCCHELEMMKTGQRFTYEEFIGLVNKYEIDKYDILEISGGEPTFNKETFIQVLKWLNESKGFSKKRMNVLTTAQSFSNFDFARETSKYLGHVTSTFYSPSEGVHDSFTGRLGSYKKKLEGLNNLQKNGVQLHIKTILNVQNFKDVSDFIDLCIENFKEAHIVIGWLCLIGEAWNNQKNLALNFHDVEFHMNKAIQKARKAKLNLNITIPLCLLDPFYWKGHVPVNLLTDLEKVVFIKPDEGMFEKPANEIPILKKPSTICDECLMKSNCVWEWEGYERYLDFSDILRPVKASVQ